MAISKAKPSKTPVSLAVQHPSTRRKATGTPSQPTGTFQPPTNFSERARRIWKEQLEANRHLITNSNVVVFSKVCQLLADIEQCDEELARGWTVGDRGFRVKPELKIRESAYRTFLMYAKELGIVGKKGTTSK